MTITVFLLDDHEIVRRGVVALLESEPDITVIGEAADAESAVAGILRLKPMVSLLDVQLGSGSGIEVCREVCSADSSLACVMLTSFSEDEALLQAVLAGASGFLLKQIRGMDIVQAVRRVAAGESLIEPGTSEMVRARLKNTGSKDPLIASLTPQEQKLLGLLADGKTNRQIASEMFLAEKTIKNYVSNLLAKMGMKRRTEAAVYATRAEVAEGKFTT